MNDNPLTIGQAAKQFDIPKGTIRGWVKQFSEYLSESARPPSGETKLLTPDDMTVLYTVYFLRARHKSMASIHDDLAAGVRHIPETAPQSETKKETETPPDDNQAAQDDAGKTQTAETAITIYTAFSDTLQLYESRVSAYETELKEERAARLAAEIRAASAETKLQVLEDAQKKTATPASSPWWQRIFGKR